MLLNKLTHTERIKLTRPTEIRQVDGAAFQMNGQRRAIVLRGGKR
ncbi:Uncharacterised protein [Salmonella enterica subsp. enterica serovar Bovismorbificans]|uniref:Uncharacterized protein n=1 Tax=Salmonella enterica subsp. enterica serovar Bovismorbificans TaxID=58097 RepID=A0A655EN89_SALET|nr:Uncharacterised protein [Salmonella enterica subsp. enterica serovar Bovismorbificans]